MPINYWIDHIDHNTIVWFDHCLVQDECIANIKYAIYTTFTFNDTVYRIFYDYVDELFDSLDEDTYKLDNSSDQTKITDLFRENYDQHNQNSMTNRLIILHYS